MSVLSVVNDKLWRNATGEVTSNDITRTNSGYGLVTITPDITHSSGGSRSSIDNVNIPTITGIMLEPFSYSITSDWSGITTPFDAGLSNIANDISVGAGYGNLTGVWTSKLYWKQSGYITSDLKFRLIDYNGTGAIMVDIGHLMRYVVSSYNGGSFAANLEDNAEKFITDAQSKNLTGEDAQGNVIATNEDLARNTALDAIGYAFDDVTSLLEPKASPPPMAVNVGKVFGRDNMLCTSLSFDYSREYTENGPMYVDVTMAITSRTFIRNFDDSGVKTAQNGRVVIEDSVPIVVDHITTPDVDVPVIIDPASNDMSRVDGRRHIQNQRQGW